MTCMPFREADLDNCPNIDLGIKITATAMRQPRLVDAVNRKKNKSAPPFTV